jgi:hypothetical protein
MNYTKPEVNTLGQAKTVIAQGGTVKPTGSPWDGGSAMTKTVIPAYDLDE